VENVGRTRAAIENDVPASATAMIQLANLNYSFGVTNAIKGG